MSTTTIASVAGLITVVGAATFLKRRAQKKATQQATDHLMTKVESGELRIPVVTHGTAPLKGVAKARFTLPRFNKATAAAKVEVTATAPKGALELAFEAAYNALDTVVEFDDRWANGTGYFDHAVNLVCLAPGEQAKSLSTNGRRIIFTGTVFGTVVTFERYTPGTGSMFVIARNIPAELNSVVPGGSLSLEWLSDYIFDHEENLGHLVEVADTNTVNE